VYLSLKVLTCSPSFMILYRTSAGFVNRRELFGSRRLQIASGNGAGVYNEGDMTATDCKFYNCTAARGGGAIYTKGTAVVENTEFKDNEAMLGGAIYVEKGTASVTECIFEDNAPGNVFIGTTATVEGCGNEGLEGDLGLACPTSTAVASMGSLSGLSAGFLFCVWMGL